MGDTKAAQTVISFVERYLEKGKISLVSDKYDQIAKESGGIQAIIEEGGSRDEVILSSIHGKEVDVVEVDEGNQFGNALLNVFTMGNTLTLGYGDINTAGVDKEKLDNISRKANGNDYWEGYGEVGFSKMKPLEHSSKEKMLKDLANRVQDVLEGVKIGEHVKDGQARTTE